MNPNKQITGIILQQEEKIIRKMFHHAILSKVTSSWMAMSTMTYMPAFLISKWHRKDRKASYTMWWYRYKKRRKRCPIILIPHWLMTISIKRLLKYSTLDLHWTSRTLNSYVVSIPLNGSTMEYVDDNKRWTERNLYKCLEWNKHQMPLILSNHSSQKRIEIM